MWFKLALRLGKTVEELKEKMTWDEFLGWVAFNRINPIGDERADILNARLMAMIAGVMGNKVEPQDFLMKYWEPPMTAERLAKKIHLAMSMFKVKTGDK